MESCKGLDPWAFFNCVILPTNPEAFWVFIQALAVVIALVVALLQLRAFLRSETLKNAMKVTQDYFDARYGRPSVSDAIRTLALNASTAPPIFDRVAKGTATTQDWNTLRPIHEAFLIVDNYFDDAADLFLRRGIDRDYFLSREVNLIQQAHEIMAPYYVLETTLAPNANRVSMERLQHEASLYLSRLGRKKSVGDFLVQVLVGALRGVLRL